MSWVLIQQIVKTHLQTKINESTEIYVTFKKRLQLIFLGKVPSKFTSCPSSKNSFLLTDGGHYRNHNRFKFREALSFSVMISVCCKKKLLWWSMRAMFICGKDNYFECCQARYWSLKVTVVGLLSITSLVPGSLPRFTAVMTSVMLIRPYVCWLESVYDFLHCSPGTPSGSAHYCASLASHPGRTIDIMSLFCQLA